MSEATDKSLNVNVLAEITRIRQCACAVSLADKTFAGTTFAKRDLATSILEGTDYSHKITAAQLLQMIDEGE